MARDSKYGQLLHSQPSLLVAISSLWQTKWSTKQQQESQETKVPDIHTHVLGHSQFAGMTTQLEHEPVQAIGHCYSTMHEPAPAGNAL